jgi:RNA recognition motif-containing protein
VKIYVGNISFETDEAALRSAFAEHGDVDEVAVITDRDTGRSRGFAFVTMPDDAAARAAMQALNGRELDGRTLNVNEARAKTGAGGGGGGRGGGGGGGGRDRRRGGW